MPRLKIRRANLRDLETLIAHRRGMWFDMGYKNKAELEAADKVYRRWAQPHLKTGELVGFIVEAGGQIAGSGCVWLRPVQPVPVPGRPGFKGGGQPYLLSMYTEHAFRGKGVATKIVKESIRWAKAKGFPRMTLHASDMGRSVYEKLGFKQTWEMKLELKPKKR
ncbi:MAG TPA: GNAT family N-acetyltransferase [candidate division Zixibacteria bacterium]|nr:GNAT family N-acetyltransferase [candidate division Zixibacteria bacterium]